VGKDRAKPGRRGTWWLWKRASILFADREGGAIRLLVPSKRKRGKTPTTWQTRRTLSGSRCANKIRRLAKGIGIKRRGKRQMRERSEKGENYPGRSRLEVGGRFQVLT